MALNELGIAKRNLMRSQLLCRHIVEHLSWIYDTYEQSHPKYADRVFIGAETAKELEHFLASLHEELCSL